MNHGEKGAPAARKRIALLFGGCSPEYGVSLQSAHAVLRHMDPRRYLPVPIGITREGRWFWYRGDGDKLLSDSWQEPEDCVPVAISPGRAHPLLLLRGDRVEELPVDAVFPVLHGRNGEDGTVQGLFALAGVPLVGCGVLASALCMDKDRAHRLAEAAGVAVPASVLLEKGVEEARALEQADRLGYPLFVKPVGAGSSYGVTKVACRRDLPAALALAFSYDGRVLLEEAISGFEVGCAVLGGCDLQVGELDEIELSHGFFDFTEKYTLKTSRIHVPARISPEKAEEMKETARRIYRALDCRGFARVDMFLEDGGRVVFNEVNTIPGFTAHSRYPAMMEAAGLSFQTLISAVIEQAGQA